MKKKQCYACGISIGEGTSRVECQFHKYAVCQDCLDTVHGRGWLNLSTGDHRPKFILNTGETYQPAEKSRFFSVWEDPILANIRLQIQMEPGNIVTA